jgi:hypothetical protein
VAAPPAVLDDWLLITELLAGLRTRRRHGGLFTTSYWYYRACRAAVVGGAGRLSGPFEQFGPIERGAAIGALLRLREDIGLPDARVVVPLMAEIAARHTQLNLLNLEACAAALNLGAVLWLSPESAAGVLPPVLDTEGIRWLVVRRA